MKKKMSLLFCALFFAAIDLVGAERVSVDVDSTTGGESTGEYSVGDVDEKVYNVTIGWEDLTYDWVYLGDDSQGKPQFDWKIPAKCQMFSYDVVKNISDVVLYKDSDCSAEYTSSEVSSLSDSYGVYRMYRPDFSEITIVDSSTGGARVTPSVSFEFNNYDEFTAAQLQYATYPCTLLNENLFNAHKGDNLVVFENETCSGHYEDIDNLTFIADKYYAYVQTVSEVSDDEITDVELPDTARVGMAGSYNAESGLSYTSISEYRLLFNIHVDDEAIDKIETPTAGEKIGTMTITLATE